jgi:hypothetical protein
MQTKPVKNRMAPRTPQHCVLAAILATCVPVTACVPTTKYAYVPPTPEAVEVARSGDAIPLVANAVSICWPDGGTELVWYAEVQGDQLCGYDTNSNDPEDWICMALNELSGIGIPYEGRSLSVVPMASVALSECDPQDLTRRR